LHGASDDRVAAVRLAQGVRDPFYVFMPGAGDKRKMLPPAFWREIAAALPEGRIAVCGTAEERDVFSAIADGNSRYVDMLGLFSLADMVLFLSMSRKIHTLDSLGSHLAALAGRPSIIYYKPGADIATWRPLGISYEMLCVVCL
jgi:ADP-heptose:LPS heptosyltransferase